MEVYGGPKMSDGLDFIEQADEVIADINLSRGGEVLPPKTNKTLLVDADTIVFSACLNCTIVEELLPEEFYTDEEWAEILLDPTFDGESNTRKFVYEDDVDAYINDKLAYMMEQTGTTRYELHFTGNKRNSFRYTQLDSMYKANRKSGQTPAGLHATKLRWVLNNPNVFIWDEWEADDICVALKRDNPDKYILAAVDKDVIYSLPGKHWNYYTSAKYYINMKWIEVSKLEAMRHHYLQTLTGDSGDNIPGLSGIGPKKALKILGDCEDHICMWEKVVAAYEAAGKSVIDAIVTMRLVSMHQLHKDKDGNYRLNLWKPPVGTTIERNNDGTE